MAEKQDTIPKIDGIPKINISSQEGINKLNKFFKTINKSSAPKSMIIGTATGWTTGFITMKVGKPAAFAIGSGIIIFQIAQHNGFVKQNWDDLKVKANKATESMEGKYGNKQTLLANVKQFAKSNRFFTTGFMGGFLIGMACA